MINKDVTGIGKKSNKNHSNRRHGDCQNYGPLRTIMVGLLFSLVVAGCDSGSSDPKQKSIPTDIELWQQTLDDTANKLPEEERQLLSRYMLRMKLSEAYESGAVPSINIGRAIEQQRNYEEKHPNNPTGPNSPLSNSQYRKEYPITLLPAQKSESDSLNTVELTFALNNTANKPIQSFKGTLLMQYPDFKEPKAVVIPYTKFEPPIASKHSAKLVADISIGNTNVMKAIKSPQTIDIIIEKGTLTLEGGQEIVFEEAN